MEVQIFDYIDKSGQEALPSSKSTHTLSVFNVHIPERRITLNQCKLMKSLKGGYFISMPSFKLEMPGKTTWIPFADLHPDDKPDFQKSVLEALKPFIKRS